METKKRTALITGGALRIGKAITRRLAAMNCNVVIQYRHSEKQARQLGGELEILGLRATPIWGELDTPDSCVSLWRKVQSAEKRIDILVNNAAIFGRISLRDSTMEDFDRFWRINTLAPVMLTKLFSRQSFFTYRPDHAESPAGHVINLLDQRITLPESGTIPYMLSKKALQAFTLSAALELAPRISVNAIAPGAVLPPPGKRKIPESAGRAPLDSRCSPEDIARAVAFIVESPCITGQVLYVDSGQHLGAK